MRAVSWQTWKHEVESDLQDNILPFWMNHTVDAGGGGFYGEVANDGTPDPDADKGLVLNARILWTFAAAYRVNPNPAYATMAERAFRFLLDVLQDAQYGGYFWMVSAKGKPVEDKKQVYGQAFAMYAYAEYYRAVGKQEALDKAIETFRLLERYSYDPANKGYFEALGRDWTETANLSLSAKDLNEKKSMNTHLHVLEAYTNLFRVWQSEELREKLRELIEVTIDRIIDPATHHFLLFFDELWQVKSHEISYGHDIEGSWLLLEAAEVLGDEAVIERVKKVAIAMAEATYREGLDKDGSIVNEADPSGWTNTNKDWWPQAEAVVGFLNAYQLTGEERYLEASWQAWRFIDAHLIDHTHGEWYWSVDRSGKLDASHTKVNAWKCPYHNGRACMEIMHRIAAITAAN